MCVFVCVCVYAKVASHNFYAIYVPALSFPQTTLHGFFVPLYLYMYVRTYVHFVAL